MQPKSSSARSTVLEGLSFETDGARLSLDGRPVKIMGDLRAPAVDALRSFYQSALADRPEPPAPPLPPPASPGLLSRFASWFLGPPRGAPRAPDASRIQPQNLSVYGDKAGVHLSWHTAPPPAEPQVAHYPLDSALAGRLQDCYTHLGELGYKVVGLDLVQAAPATRAAKAAAPDPTPPAKDPGTILVRVDPPKTERHHPAPAAAAGEADKPRVLAVPEPLLRALHTAADPSRPAEERLTFLRCSFGRKGLEIVEVGLGEGERGPARWESAAHWVATRSAEPAAPAARVRARPGPEPDL